MTENILDRFEAIRVFVFDVDGVLTNGQLLVTEEGALLRSMNIKDGYALQLAVKQGYQVWIISGATCQGASLRLQKLGITETHFGISDKQQLLTQLVTQYADIDLGKVLYMGDDMPDLQAMHLCGLKCAPKDACMDVVQIADYISSFKGGEGCVRDVIEKVLKINGHWK